MYTEDDLIPISALQHFVFCERQWGLIHLEKAWADNRLTAEGNLMHKRSDTTEVETRGDLRTVRGLSIRSLEYGLVGRADVVEFNRISKTDPAVEFAVQLPGIAGYWKPVPVEYKRGRPKKNLCDVVQLCAQAICLEEMLDTKIPAGAIYYGRVRRRTDVEFDMHLRTETRHVIDTLRKQMRLAVTPAPEFGKKCASCSMESICMPKTVQKHDRVWSYIWNSIEESGGRIAE